MLANSGREKLLPSRTDSADSQDLASRTLVTDSEYTHSAGHPSRLLPLKGSAKAPMQQYNLKPHTTLLTQFEVLSRREFMNLKRDWSLIVMHSLVAVIVGLFVGGMYFKVDTTISGFQVCSLLDSH